MKNDQKSLSKVTPAERLTKKYDARARLIADRADSDILYPYEDGISWVGGRSVTTLRGETAYDFLGLTGELAKEVVLDGKFSTTYLETKLQPIILAYRQDLEAGANLFRAFIAEIVDFSTEYTVSVPVAGLVLEVETFRVGRVTFRSVTDGVINGLVNKQDQIGRQCGHESMTPQEREHERDRLRRGLGDEVVGSYTVIAEPQRAQELAEIEIRRALEAVIFSWAGAVAYHPAADAAPRLKTASEGPLPLVVMTSEDSFHDRMGLPDSRYPIIISRQSWGSLDGNGLSEISRILAKPINELTPLEKSILRAVHWVATSQYQIDDENRMLNLITGLETLVSPVDRQSISRSIAEATALLTQRDMSRRADLMKTVSSAYTKRSNTSHGGQVSLEPTELRQMRVIVLQVIQQTLAWQSRFKTKEEFQAWINQAKLDSLRIEPGSRKTLRNLRRLRGLEQVELARALNVSADDVHRWETKGPTFEEMDRLAIFFGEANDAIEFDGSVSYLNIDGREFMIELKESSFGFWSGWVSSIRVGAGPGIPFPEPIEEASARSEAISELRVRLGVLIKEVERGEKKQGEIGKTNARSSTP